MTNHLFPPEIIEYSYQNIYFKRDSSSHVIYLVILCSLVGMLISLPIIKIDVTSQSRGLIRSKDDPHKILSPRSGFLPHYVLQDGKQVKVGDTLFVISSDLIYDQEKSLAQERNRFIEQLNSNINLLKIDANNKQLLTPKHLADAQAYQQKQNDLILEYDYWKVEDSIYKVLLNDGVIAARIYDEIHLRMSRAKDAITIHRSQSMAQWESEKLALERSIEEIDIKRSQLKQEKKSFVYRAPINGTIAKLQGAVSGGFVASGQNIGQIVPTNDLIVELAVLPKDIGLIKPGQLVKYQVDAFNYREWGFASGEVISIHEVAQTTDSEYLFRVMCSLDEKKLSLKSGLSSNLKFGMSVTGQIKLTERSILQLLFDRVDDWLNPKI